MSEQVTYKWTCGLCGDVYEVSGDSMSAIRIDLWRQRHMESNHPGYLVPPDEPERTEAVA